MNSPMISILILVGIAIFLILRLRNVLGTREGYEPVVTDEDRRKAITTARREFEVIEGGPDYDVIDHVPEGSSSAEALSKMKRAEPSFMVSEFLVGARGAYEMILMGFENGDMDQLQPFLSDEVFEAFSEVVEQRKAQGLTIDAEFIGVRETTLSAAAFNEDTQTAEITVRFVGEMTSVVKDADGNVVEGSSKSVKRQKDAWTFARDMGSDDPNWKLVATDE